LVARAAAMIITLTAVCAVLLYGPNAGYSDVVLLLALIPFVISGAILLITIWKDRHPLAVASSEVGSLPN